MTALACLRTAAVALACCASALSQTAEDPLLRAMNDELERSRALRVAGLEERPYFIEYSIETVELMNVSAMLGALMNSTHEHTRVPQVAVRAGSYEFDNTNHIASLQYSGSRYDPNQWPIDDSYPVIRHNLWLATDRAYKTALEAIARKRSSLRNAAAPDKAPDFGRAEPVKTILAVNKGTIDEAAWTRRTLDLSAIFGAYPEIDISGIDSSLYLGTAYYANSEGTRLRYPEDLYQLRAHARGQAADGTMLHDVRVFQSLSPISFSSDTDLRRGVTEVAENVRALLKAPPGEAYSGPVLFEPQAAAQLMAQVLGENLRVTRRPVSDPVRPAAIVPSELESKLNSRILPDWITVADDPTQEQFRGQELAGSYKFDMEGVPAKAVTVVEKGVLKEFLLTRQPVTGFTASNGHARLPGPFGARAAAISNLFISASGTKSLAELKAQLIDLCKRSNKPYGMLVRKLDYPSSASMIELRGILESSRGSTRPVSPPVLSYRVYPDGREELVRGLRFRGVSVRSLRDILAASSESAVFHFINNGALFATIGLGGFVAPASVVSPALLFEEIEFERPQEEQSRPPLVPAPPIEKPAR
jgi:hypothetical protein